VVGLGFVVRIRVCVKRIFAASLVVVMRLAGRLLCCWIRVRRFWITVSVSLRGSIPLVAIWCLRHACDATYEQLKAPDPGLLRHLRDCYAGKEHFRYGVREIAMTVQNTSCFDR
jgi:hypothetical protein